MLAAMTPLVLSEPNPRQALWRGLPTAWRNVMAHRQLIKELCMRDIRLKYRGSLFGYFWSLLEPLLMAATFVALFAIISKQRDSAGSLLVVLGIIVWGYFGAAAQKGQSSLTGNAGLIESIYVPREIFAVAAIYAQAIMTVLSLLVAIPFLVYLGIWPSPMALIYVPLGLLLTTLIATGVGMGSAPWNVLNRDVEYFFTFITRAGLYLSPVMWDVEMIPASLRPVVLLNPMCVPMEMVKKSIVGRPLDISAGNVTYSCVACVVIFVLGITTFRRMEGLVVKKL